MLHDFITENRDTIIERCRAKVSARGFPEPSKLEIDEGVPMFLDQLVETLQAGTEGEGTRRRAMDKSAGAHGHDMRRQGYTVSQVVHDYGDICQTITELALELNAPISTEDFRVLNKCLDQAIAEAVTMFAQETRKSEVAQDAAHGNERIGFLVHELRNLVNTAIVSFEVLKTGSVGISGSTGSVLSRSLEGLRDLIARSLDEVQSKHRVAATVPISVGELIAEAGETAMLAANERGVKLSVVPPEERTVITADRPVVSAVVGNLLQNAIKFTRPHSTVTLRAVVKDGSALIEVHDECGGLPVGDPEDLFRPFEQRGSDRTGIGVGLAFSRWGAEASGGKLYARDLPHRGCVFTLEMPITKAAVAAVAGDEHFVAVK